MSNRLKINPYFFPPAEFENSRGDYPSALMQADGSEVCTPDEWAARRLDIRSLWLDALGPMPEVPDTVPHRVLRVEARESFELRKIEFEVQPGWEEPAYVLLPHADGPVPGVVVTYYDPETAIGFRGGYNHFAKDLAERGFAAISIGMNRLEFPLDMDPFCQPLVFRAAVALRAHRILSGIGQVDGKRIGVIGHSFGGKWAQMASCLNDAFACAVWSDPGCVFDESKPNCNWWDPWYLGYEPDIFLRHQGAPSMNGGKAFGGYRVLCEAGRDMTDLIALMAPRPVLLSGGSEDPPQRWQALHDLIQVNRLLGYEHRVALTSRDTHAQNQESQAIAYAFLEHFLSPETNT